MDLKGKDSVPEFVHHTVYRLNVAEQRVEGTSKMAGTTALLRNVQTFTDNVHVSVQGSSDPGCAKVVDPEATSQAIKEAKQKILLEIVDKFEVNPCHYFIVFYVCPYMSHTCRCRSASSSAGRTWTVTI